VLGSATGSLAQYTAAYAVSYIIGYLVFLIPGGVGPREFALIAALTSMGLANPKEAAVIAVTSRLWLTVLEILPGLLYLARRPGRAMTSTPRDGSNP